MDNKEENENQNTGEEEQTQQQEQQEQDPLAAPFSGGNERYRDRGLQKKNIIPGASALNTVTKGANKANAGIGKLNTKVQGKNPDGAFAKGMNKTSSSINKGTNSLNAFNNRMQNINNAANRIGQVAEDPKAATKDAISETAKQAVKKKIKLVFMALPLPVKIVILVAIGVFFFFLIIICAMSFEDIDTGSGEIGGHTYTVGNTKYWWPIGSSTTTGSGSSMMAGDQPLTSHISSGYGPRSSPGGVGSTNHQGIDIAGGWADGSTYAIASVDGQVFEVLDSCHGSNYRRNKNGSGCSTPRGNNVKVKNLDGNVTVYQHLYSVNVKVGDNVKQGQVLGTIGSSGSVTGNHLHFEVWVNDVPVNPVTYVDRDYPRPQPTISGLPSDATNIQKVCLVLKSNGYPDDAIAGIIGNMQRESGVSIDSYITNWIGCVGVVQWCYGRKTNLQNTYGSAWGNIENQIQYIVNELNGPYAKVKNYLMASHSIEEKTDYFCNHYEIPGTTECAKSLRRDNANNIYSYVQKGCK